MRPRRKLYVSRSGLLANYPAVYDALLAKLNADTDSVPPFISIRELSDALGWTRFATIRFFRAHGGLVTFETDSNRLSDLSAL
jgi:hypothetical protein